MKALLLADNSLPLAIPALCELVSTTCRTLKLVEGKATVRIETPTISAPRTIHALARTIGGESVGCDEVFVCTAVQYENNYFFENDGDINLLSFFGWNLVTGLPVTNGVIYFIASVLYRRHGRGSHQENTGCLNDFWWDKRGVDVGMRAAFVCADCKRKFKGDKAVLADIERLLDLLSTASRADRDVLAISNSNARGTDAGYDAFLCHNSEDKPAIRKINQELKSRGIRTWFDEDQLQPGMVWASELERQIPQVRAACVFVGPNGRGPWQDMEIRAFLSEFARHGCPVIPVLLEGASVPDLPLFLRQMMWVDLRNDYFSNLSRLVTALTPRRVP